MAADPTTTGPSAPGGARRNIFSRFRQWLPAQVDRRVIAAAWATLVVQVGIVGTGGLVRLTGSGLGCPTWPRCTAESLVAYTRDGHPRHHRVRQPSADVRPGRRGAS